MAASAMRVQLGFEQRRCSACKRWKSLDWFYCWERSDQRGRRWSLCRPCLEKQTRRAQAEKKQWLERYKLDHGCADCGYNAHPAALDFDHVRGEKKRCDIKRGASFGWKSLMVEVEKCDVVCANCHRIRTVERNKEVLSG